MEVRTQTTAEASLQSLGVLRGEQCHHLCVSAPRFLGVPARAWLSHGIVTAAHAACSAFWFPPLKEQLVLQGQEKL